MNIAPQDVLTRCPQCGAWPMAAFDVDARVTWARLSFRCSKCHRPETIELSQPGKGAEQSAARPY